MGEDCAEGQSVVFSDCITVFFFYSECNICSEFKSKIMFFDRVVYLMAIYGGPD